MGGDDTYRALLSRAWTATRERIRGWAVHLLPDGRMTARDIADRYLLSAKGQTPERLEKAKALAVRMGVPWSKVEELLPKEQA